MTEKMMDAINLEAEAKESWLDMQNGNYLLIEME